MIFVGPKITRTFVRSRAYEFKYLTYERLNKEYYAECVVRYLLCTAMAT